jgi:hypothetical protein
MNVLITKQLITTSIVDMDADDRTVLRLALRTFLTHYTEDMTRVEYIQRAKELLEQLDRGAM